MFCSAQEFIEIEAWLVLTVFICLHNQLRSIDIHSIHSMHVTKSPVLGQLPPRRIPPPPPNLKTNPKPNPNPTREDQFTSGPTDWLPPSLNLTLLLTQTLTLTGEQFSSGGNCPDTKEFSCLKKVIHQIDRK